MWAFKGQLLNLFYKVLNKLLPPGEYIISCETDISVNKKTDKQHIAKILKLNVFRIKECEEIPESEASKKNELSGTSDKIKSKLNEFCEAEIDKINCDNNQPTPVKRFQEGLQPFYEKWARTPIGRYFLYNLSKTREKSESISQIFEGCNEIDGVYGKCTEGALRAWCQYSPKKS